MPDGKKTEMQVEPTERTGAVKRKACELDDLNPDDHQLTVYKKTLPDHEIFLKRWRDYHVTKVYVKPCDLNVRMEKVFPEDGSKVNANVVLSFQLRKGSKPTEDIRQCLTVESVHSKMEGDGTKMNAITEYGEKVLGLTWFDPKTFLISFVPWTGIFEPSGHIYYNLKIPSLGVAYPGSFHTYDHPLNPFHLHVRFQVGNHSEIFWGIFSFRMPRKDLFPSFMEFVSTVTGRKKEGIKQLTTHDKTVLLQDDSDVFNLQEDSLVYVELIKN